MLKIIKDGITIEVPREVESEGAAAVESYVEKCVAQALAPTRRRARDAAPEQPASE